LNTCIVGLGSNIQPRKHIREVRKILGGQFKILKESKFVSTKSVGVAKQADFLNGALLLVTDFTLSQLRSQLKRIEQDLGRRGDSPSYGPRTIDLDILVWNDRVVDKDFYERDFIKDAVLALSPDIDYSPKKRFEDEI